jgi:thiopurine S-methyltransferase
MHEFWRERWRTQQIGFHLEATNPLLLRHGARWAEGLAPGARVLVPLSGKTRDLTFLADRGLSPVGVELVPEAIEAYFTERGLGDAVERRVEHGTPIHRAGGVELIEGDLFAIPEPVLGRFLGVYDRAAMIALGPDDRARYAARLVAGLEPRGRILLIALEYDQTRKPGPPFSVHRDEVRRTYPGLQVELLSEHDALPSSPRFREAGVEALLETAWLISKP